MVYSSMFLGDFGLIKRLKIFSPKEYYSVFGIS